MTDQELQAQFKRCQAWNDPEQWQLLALVYYQRGYKLNALRCFQLADACRLLPGITEQDTDVRFVTVQA